SADLAARPALRPPVLGVPAADRVRPDHGHVDGGPHLPGRLHPRRTVRADHGGADAGPAAVPRGPRRERAGADRRTPAVDAAPTGTEAHPRHARRRALRAHRRRPPGPRGLVPPETTAPSATVSPSPRR